MIVVDNWNWPQFVMLFILVLGLIVSKTKVYQLIVSTVELIILYYGGFFK